MPIKQSKTQIQTINFRFSANVKKAGKYKGELNAILDKKKFIVLGELVINVISPEAKADWIGLPFLVLVIGAVGSWFMAIQIPALRKKHHLKIKLSNLRTETRELTEPKSVINRKLLRKIFKISQLNQTSQFSAVDERIKETENLLTICRKV